jgi:hypothetical protein
MRLLAGYISKAILLLERKIGHLIKKINLLHKPERWDVAEFDRRFKEVIEKHWAGSLMPKSVSDNDRPLLERTVKRSVAIFFIKASVTEDPAV